jgi:hypothetical protein
LCQKEKLAKNCAKKFEKNGEKLAKKIGEKLRQKNAPKRIGEIETVGFCFPPNGLLNLVSTRYLFLHLALKFCLTVEVK